MMRFFFLIAASLTLVACAQTQQFYDGNNFQAQPWATMPFDQAKATCRDASLEHNWFGDTYDLAAPKYKSCMEKEGFKYAGPNPSGSAF